MKNVSLFVICCLFICWACQPAAPDENPSSGSNDTETVANPAAPGFNATASDERAVAIADEVMEAMGGRRAWDTTRYLHWNFFGARRLLWDKEKGRVRIEVPQEEAVYLVNINDNSGKVMRQGALVEHPDSLAKYVERGKRIWINDAYWLVMPYKLKDSGVALKYHGEDTTQTGAPADVLELSFENVGVTPQNKYHVYVDKDSRLITQWAFFRNASDPEPAFITPWADYQQHGGILLSGDRGERQLTDIQVYQEVPDQAFNAFDPVDYGRLN